MFGQNPVRKQVAGDGQSLWIQSVFYTIQGEGPFSGQCAVFIRLAGCNLRCYFCDTDFESSDWRPDLAELSDRVEGIRQQYPHVDLVVITGGEPFRQNIVPLCQQLLSDGFRVQIETAGTLSLDGFPFADDRVHVVCSPKTPQLHQDMRFAHSWKYVISTEVDVFDGLPVYSMQREHKPARIARPMNTNPVWLLPCDENDAEKNKKNLQLATRTAMQFGYRLCVQLHKLANIE